jgi:hypothetical protein
MAASYTTHAQLLRAHSGKCPDLSAGLRLDPLGALKLPQSTDSISYGDIADSQS